MLTTVLGGEAVFEENQPWTLDREGALSDYIFSIAMTPIADARGDIQGVFHTATETTDAVKLRRIQRGDELTAVFESMPDAVYVGTLDGITHCNQNALTMLGAASLEDLQERIGDLGRRFAVRSIATGELIAEDKLSFVRALQTGKTAIEEVMATRQDTGETVYIRGASAPILENGKVIAAVAINTDISEQYRARKELHQSEARLKALVASSSDAIYKMSPDWAVMHHLQGDTTESAFLTETVSINPNWLQDYIPFDEQPRVLSAIETAIRNKSVFELEHRVQRADGSTGWTISRAVPLCDEHGEITEWFGMASDVTERKLAQEALIKSEKLAAVGRLSSTIAHEINNPLEAITNIVYLLRSEPLPNHVLEYLKTVDEELAQVTNISRQTLSFSRGGSSVQRLYLRHLVGGVLAILAPRLRNKRIKLDQDLDAEGAVMGVDGELRQVVTNLINNSIDALPDAGTIKVKVSKLTRLTASLVRLTIFDNGSGIPPEALDRIFEPFFSLKPIIGTGLGLWITREIIQKHGATLRVRSSVKPGASYTAFTIVFPAAGGSIS